MTDTLAAFSTRVRTKDSFDTGLFFGLIALGVTGVIMIYSATRQALVNGGYNPHYYLERQGIFVVLGIVAMYIVSRIDSRRFEIAATPLYIGSLVALAGVLVICQSALGAQRWYSFGSII